jgi:2-oxoglutarate dehydrogenase E2 component (dihydrolipoamide succinyltransferase)
VTPTNTDSVVPDSTTPTPEISPLPATSADTVVAPTINPANEAVADSGAQSLEAEEAELQAQIDSFAKDPATSEVAPAVSPASASPTPAAVTPVPEQPATTLAPAASANDQTIQNAVNELNDTTSTTPVLPPSVVNAAPAPAPGTPAAAPAAPAATDTSNSQAVAGKKVIQPLSNPAADINALLAKEEAKEAVTTPTPSATVTPAAPGVTPTPASVTPPTTTPPAAPGQSIDPNTVAL